MNTKISNRRLQGLTLVESLVVMVILAVLVAMILPYFGRARQYSGNRMFCINNMKQIGTAYRIWENDNGGKYPMQQPEVEGGMQEVLSNSVSAGPYAYLTYTTMQNEMGQSPKIVLCPNDDRIANTNFYPGTLNAPQPGKSFNLGGVGTFDNTNVSYFCGVGASDTYPQSLLGGDRNLGNGGVVNPANGSVTETQDPYYGISGVTVNPGYPCGADAILNTNGSWSFAVVSGGGGSVGRGEAVAWSAKMHSAGNTVGAGNIMLGDGSAQQCTSYSFRQNWLKNAADTGNFASSDKIHTSKGGSIRLLFP